MYLCPICGSTTHRDDAMESRCNGCEYLTRQCICKKVSVDDMVVRDSSGATVPMEVDVFEKEYREL